MILAPHPRMRPLENVGSGESHPDYSGRILLAKVGLDGHDRGVKVVARGLRDSGFHVIYGGIWQSPEVVACAARDEDADWLGLSLLSGAHMTLVPRVLAALRDSGNRRTRCLLGGIVPEQDIAQLRQMGVAGVFGPATSIAAITEFLDQSRECQTQDSIAKLAQASQAGDRASLARLLTLIERGRAGQTVMQGLSQEKEISHRIRTVAITGSAGVGKSSLIARLLPVLRERGLRVAVLACDPQSPFTGGALLGDRVRMCSSDVHDSGILVRSLAVPSGQQGISQNLDAMTVALAAHGFDLVLIESVGVGQGDVAVREIADSVIVLLQPASGDTVQWEKAGVLEIADMIVIQKCDLPGADRLEAELKQTLNLPGCRDVPIVRVGGEETQGLHELGEYILN